MTALPSPEKQNMVLVTAIPVLHGIHRSDRLTSSAIVLGAGPPDWNAGPERRPDS